MPDAAREATEVAKLYNSLPPLTGSNATKDRIIKDIDKADIFHFAGHYLPNDKAPLLSKFILASGDLTIEEITQKRLPHMRLIILSACDTGVEKIYNGEGMIGAARAFLALDVPLVVASQWKVDSVATTDLMIRFHQYRKRQKISTMAALRAAQIDMLKDEKSRFQQPFYWAGFLPIGGFADY